MTAYRRALECALVPLLAAGRRNRRAPPQDTKYSAAEAVAGQIPALDKGRACPGGCNSRNAKSHGSTGVNCPAVWSAKAAKQLSSRVG